MKNISPPRLVRCSSVKPILAIFCLVTFGFFVNFLSTYWVGFSLKHFCSFSRRKINPIGSFHELIIAQLRFEQNDWADLLLHLVPSWNEKGTKLKELKWPDKQALTADSVKKVPSWEQKGTKLIHKKVLYFISILTLCSQPVGLDQMMSWLNYKNRKTFRDNYLLPLQKVGFVILTIPEKPSDPNQKYETTEKGKLFLAGRDF